MSCFFWYLREETSCLPQSCWNNYWLMRVERHPFLPCLRFLVLFWYVDFYRRRLELNTSCSSERWPFKLFTTHSFLFSYKHCFSIFKWADSHLLDDVFPQRNWDSRPFLKLNEIKIIKDWKRNLLRRWFLPTGWRRTKFVSSFSPFASNSFSIYFLGHLKISDFRLNGFQTRFIGKSWQKLFKTSEKHFLFDVKAKNKKLSVELTHYHRLENYIHKSIKPFPGSDLLSYSLFIGRKRTIYF